MIHKAIKKAGYASYTKLVVMYSGTHVYIHIRVQRAGKSDERHKKYTHTLHTLTVVLAYHGASVRHAIQL